MTIVLIFLTGVLMGAINIAFFFFGYYVRDKKKDDNALELDEHNVEAVKSLMDWIGYNGEGGKK